MLRPTRGRPRADHCRARPHRVPARGPGRDQARVRRFSTGTRATGAARNRAEQEEAAHLKAECALREHSALGLWLRQTPSGRLVLDRVKIQGVGKVR